MIAYYNEIDPFAAQWLRNLIVAGHIVPGDVDERSIVDVQPDDLKGYTQCHFFAGIGGWSHALRLAGWPDDRLVWTGSCPCQPFSTAGKRTYDTDARHLWPQWYQLIMEGQPATVFGEQVAGQAGWAWLQRVQDDMEASDYAVSCAEISAVLHRPQRRPRLFFVADRTFIRLEKSRLPEKGCDMVGGNSWASWSSQNTMLCTDGKRRPLEPGIVPLAHGLPFWMEQVRTYGNAIVPQVAATFIQAYREAVGERYSSETPTEAP